MLILNGRDVAEHVRAEISDKVKQLESKYQRTPGLAVILIGEDPASQVYVRNKVSACEKVGMKSFKYELAESVSKEEVEDLIQKLNQDTEVSGILLQLPVPKHLNGLELIDLIDPLKDPDCLTSYNMGKLAQAKPIVSSCTPLGAMKILEHYNIPVAGKKAVVVGRSIIVGKPMFHLLNAANATVTMCHSKTKDIKAYTKDADIVVTAIGQPKMFDSSYFHKDSVIIDVGITRLDSGKLSGDVDFHNVKDHVKAITPVPGGVGPMTITMLLQNTLELFIRQNEA